jgi:hypothetical protein
MCFVVNKSPSFHAATLVLIFARLYLLQTLDHFKRNSVKKLDSDWEGAKSELLEALGFSSALLPRGTSAPSTPMKPGMDFTAAALASPATPLGRAGAARSAQEAVGKMTAYGKVVDELNQQRREKRSFSTMQAFQQAARTVDDTELVALPFFLSFCSRSTLG